MQEQKRTHGLQFKIGKGFHGRNSDVVESLLNIGSGYLRGVSLLLLFCWLTVTIKASTAAPKHYIHGKGLSTSVLNVGHLGINLVLKKFPQPNNLPV